MHIIIIDVNVLVDEALCSVVGSLEEEQATKLLELVCANKIPFGISAAMLKDLKHLIEARTKLLFMKEYGKLKPEDCSFIKQFADKKIEWYLENATIISEGLVDCRMAHSLLKVHSDYEDNLVTAIAIRTDATGIVTRDKAFAKSCQVKCFTPAEAILTINAGLWH